MWVLENMKGVVIGITVLLEMKVIYWNRSISDRVTLASNVRGVLLPVIVYCSSLKSKLLENPTNTYWYENDDTGGCYQTHDICDKNESYE